MTKHSSAARKLSARKTAPIAQAIEALEARAYLTGVVFGTPVNLSAASVGVAPAYTDLVDLNGDNKADLVVANQAQGSVGNSVSIMLGNGNGTFGTPTTFPLSFSPLTILDGQLGTNGKTDIVVGSASNDSVAVLLQASDGSFSQQTLTATGLANTQSVAIGNFGNGRQDIAVASFDSGTSNNVAVFMNNGDGTFTLSQVLSVPHARLASLTSFTVSGGFSDLAVADDANNAVTVLTNNGSGTFSVGSDYTVGAGPVTIKSGQFDLANNSNEDLVTANSQGGSVSVLLGNGDGTFQSSAVTSTVSGVPAGGGPLKVRVANLNSDSYPDLLGLLSAGSSGDAEVLLGNGDGTFHVGNIISTNGGTRTSIAAGDLNGDGLTDLVLANSSQITALLNTTNLDTTAPTAAVDITQPAQTANSATITFTVTYTDAQQIDTSTLNSNNVTVTDPNGANRPVTLVSTNLANAASVTVTYSFAASGGSLSAADDGTYTVTATSNAGDAVKNADAIPTAGGSIGTFVVQVSTNSNGPNLVAGAVNARLKANYVAGTKFAGAVNVTVVNSGNARAQGKIVVNLYALTSASIPGGAPVLSTVTRNVNIKPGGRAVIPLKAFTWPSNLVGQYYLVAYVDATNTLGETTLSDNVGISSTSTVLAAPYIDIENLWKGNLPKKVTLGKRLALPVLLQNAGNTTARGTATVTVEGLAAGSDTPITLGQTTVRINAAAGRKQTVNAAITMPTTLASGTYNVLITVTLPGDTNAGNNTATSVNTFTV